MEKPDVTQQPGQQPNLLTSPLRRTAAPTTRRGWSLGDILLSCLAPLLALGVLIVLLVQPPDGRSQESKVGDGAGGDGIGDRYYPGAGGQGYDVDSYTIDLTWDGLILTGHTTVRAVATEDLGKVHLDLVLPTSRAQVNGTDVGHETKGEDDLLITPADTIGKGSTFEVTVDYAGDPAKEGRTNVESPWWHDIDTVTAVGEPYVASWWYPSNDHPRDEANLDVSITVPAGFEAISVGTLVGRDVRNDPATDTWHWRTLTPIVTYATFFTVGQYRIESGNVQDAMTKERPYFYAVSEQLPPAAQDKALAAMRTTPRWVGELEKIYGPYPLSEIGGVVVPHDMWFGGMETQIRPVYAPSSILADNFKDRLIIHEMAHMWFGDTVNLQSWSDIFLNEGYASHAEWMVAEQRGGTKADAALKDYFESTNDEFWTIRLDDPGADQLFETVYQRGPMALQALRNLLGDKEFAALNKQWAAKDGPRSVEEWYALAQTHTKTDLTPWREAWLSGTEKPKPSREIGYPQ